MRATRGLWTKNEEPRKAFGTHSARIQHAFGAHVARVRILLFGYTNSRTLRRKHVFCVRATCGPRACKQNLQKSIAGPFFHCRAIAGPVPGHRRTIRKIVLKLVGICVKLVKLVKLGRKISKGLFFFQFSRVSRVSRKYQQVSGRALAKFHMSAQRQASPNPCRLYACGPRQVSPKSSRADKQAPKHNGRSTRDGLG